MKLKKQVVHALDLRYVSEAQKKRIKDMSPQEMKKRFAALRHSSNAYMLSSVGALVLADPTVGASYPSSVYLLRKAYKDEAERQYIQRRMKRLGLA